MNGAEFQSRAEAAADRASAIADALSVLNKELLADVGETKRYLSLARTAAQESELWLGRAMVAYAGSRPK